jgi:solute carrier family 6 GABA transporter-like protein 1
MIRYIAAPILAIVYSFSYSGFYEVRNDPLHILGFAVGHIALIIIFAGFMLPRWFNVMIPPERRNDGKLDIGARVPADQHLAHEQAATEAASLEERPDVAEEKKADARGDLENESSRSEDSPGRVSPR